MAAGSLDLWDRTSAGEVHQGRLDEIVQTGPANFRDWKRYISRNCIGGTIFTFRLRRRVRAKDPVAWELGLWNGGPVYAEYLELQYQNNPCSVALHRDCSNGLNIAWLALARRCGPDRPTVLQWREEVIS